MPDTFESLVAEMAVNQKRRSELLRQSEALEIEVGQVLREGQEISTRLKTLIETSVTRILGS